jgi:hypothetical protein
VLRKRVLQPRIKGRPIALIIEYLYIFIFFAIMKEIKAIIKEEDPKNWILPGNTLNQDEFIAEIRKAEKGPFYTIQESMENVEQWIKSRENP